MRDILFYLLAFSALASALLAVSLKEVLHAALALMASLFASAGIFLLLHAELLALAHVLVYIGGVVVFIVYVILLTKPEGETRKKNWQLQYGLAGLTVLGFLLLLFFSVPWKNLSNQKFNVNDESGSLTEAGLRLLTTSDSGFILAFELMSVLLLMALIGAASIAKKSDSDLDSVQSDLSKGKSL